MAGVYFRLYQRAPEFLKRRINPLEYAIRDLVSEAAALPAGSNILDAGAGEARFAADFASHRYVALDSAAGDSEWDYSRLHLRGDLARLPLAPQVFDAVVCTQVLEHVVEPARVLQEFNRVLRTGGEVFLSAPQGWCEHQQPEDFFRFTRYSLERLLQGAGFDHIRIQPMGGYFHYLGNRLTFLPRYLFADQSGWRRLVLLPLEIVALALFGVIFPVLCYYFDGFDQRREFTLGYRCRAVKAEPKTGAVPDEQSSGDSRPTGTPA